VLFDRFDFGNGHHIRFMYSNKGRGGQLLFKRAKGLLGEYLA
jgi:hypothetical protein